MTQSEWKRALPTQGKRNLMAFTSRQCRAQSRSTGKRCRQPTVEGSYFCRLHGGEKKTAGEAKAKRKAEENAKAKKRRGQGDKSGNTNALKHGAYSMRLMPEEEPIYEEKRKAFTAALGTVDVFDEQILHLLSLISTKVDQAVMKGAEHAAYGGMIKQILDLMKELKATRASRDTSTEGQNLTYADLFTALRERFGEDVDECDEGEKSLEKDTVERNCSKCGFTMEHELEDDCRWRCRNCGHLTEVEPEVESPKDSETDGDAENPAKASNAIGG
jgi:hypothetical protein